MNRRERRASGKKLSRNATSDEILPSRHGPVQTGLVDVMKAAVDVLREHLGANYHITLFVAEASVPAGEDRLPRFNYMSTAAREDMLAVLAAFVEKNRAAGPSIDKIHDEPPTGAKQ